MLYRPLFLFFVGQNIIFALAFERKNELLLVGYPINNIREII
ncbi:hypothetical protein GPLA_0136 [Paraglaciecola polaris LMG 21857]|uniref:Uncharacterized protein n=1 Tax=Paraglaciecola polaris LMG 21857 TaxID=1129793 RepID=K6ZL53_9ALTE|nr:hypothetical protein GPLA_0136 [Paraglaciecola polaris LMG 21857]